MKNYKITVNGKSYDVEVEEVQGYPQTMSTTSALSQSNQGANSSQSPSTAVSCAAQSGEPITAPLQGIVLTVAVKKGDSVKKGDLLLKIEAMKMENEVIAPRDCTIESVNVNDGDRVSSGDVLLNIR